MTKINKEEVKKVAHLARLELNENEINNHAKQLENILDYIRQLEKIDTNDVPCTTRAIEVMNVFRKDEKKNSNCTACLLISSSSSSNLAKWATFLTSFLVILIMLLKFSYLIIVY